MRVLYLLFLLPLGAFASCPAGLKLSNVPISTALPYCVKWESSTLGGCEVSCPGVCVEFPIDGTKGPMETTGSECELGGGGETGGGETGGGGTGGGGTGGGDPFMHRSPPLWVFDGGSVNLAHGFDAVSTNIERFKNSYESTEYSKRYELKFIAKDIAKIAQNTTGLNGGAGSYGSLFFEMNAHLKSLSEKSVFEPNFWNDKDIARTKQLSDMRQDISYLGGELQYITDILRSGGGGSSGGGSGGGELAAIQAMMQSNMSTMGSISGNTRSMDSNLRNMSGKLGSIDSTLSTMNSTNSSQLGDMQGSLAAIRGMTQQALNSGWGNSGGGQDIDYSKMPGSADNRLHVAGAEYKSGLCQEGDNCAFNLGKINKQYDDKKAELKAKYGAIKDEVSQVFKFEFSGSASAPKCFDMFSLFGKSYEVCPNSGEYWVTLAALMMFIFYFIALMIVARR